MPEREDDHLTPATKLLEKRREMIEVENALTAEKEVSCSLIKNLLKTYFLKIFNPRNFK